MTDGLDVVALAFRSQAKPSQAKLSQSTSLGRDESDDQHGLGGAGWTSVEDVRRCFPGGCLAPRLVGGRAAAGHASDRHQDTWLRPPSIWASRLCVWGTGSWYRTRRGKTEERLPHELWNLSQF